MIQGQNNSAVSENTCDKKKMTVWIVAPLLSLYCKILSSPWGQETVRYIWIVQMMWWGAWPSPALLKITSPQYEAPFEPKHPSVWPGVSEVDRCAGLQTIKEKCKQTLWANGSGRRAKGRGEANRCVSALSSRFHQHNIDANATEICLAVATNKLKNTTDKPENKWIPLVHI